LFCLLIIYYIPKEKYYIYLYLRFSVSFLLMSEKETPSPSGSAFTTEAKDVNKNPDSIMDAKRDQVK
jgi:hypothetical protein